MSAIIAGGIFMNTVCAIALIAIAVVAPATAAAADLTVGGRIVHITPTPGFCALNRSIEVDAVVLGKIARIHRDYNELVDFWSKCGRLNAYRIGLVDDLSPYVLVLAHLRKNGRIVPADMALADYLNGMRRELAKNHGGKDVLDEAMTKTIEERLREVLADLGSVEQVKVGETRILGVIAEDEVALYLGMVQRLITESGDRLLACVAALTELNGIGISVNIYDEYAGPQTFDALQAQARSIAAQLVPANPTSVN